MNSELITKTTINGVTYFSTVRRGVEYTARWMESVQQWFVSSRRLALGRRNIGGGKYISRIEDHKAFAALPVLMDMKAI